SSLWHGMTTEMRLPRYMRTSSVETDGKRVAGMPAAGGARVPEANARQRASAGRSAGFSLAQAASVAGRGCRPGTRRHALRSLRLDHSFRTAGIMRGLNRMLMVRKHS